jgi:hypothetical protein
VGHITLALEMCLGPVVKGSVSVPLGVQFLRGRPSSERSLSHAAETVPLPVLRTVLRPSFPIKPEVLNDFPTTAMQFRQGFP